MKNATVAKKSGQRTPSSPSNADWDIIFMCIAQPRPSSRSGPQASDTSATYASSSVGSRAETRPTLAPSSWPSSACVSSTSGLRLDDEQLGLVALLDRDGDGRRRARAALDRGLGDAVDLDLDDLPSRTRFFSSLGVPSATIFPFAITAIRSQSASASNM